MTDPILHPLRSDGEVFAVDDSGDFIAMLELTLSASERVRGFTDAREALALLHAREAQTRTRLRETEKALQEDSAGDLLPPLLADPAITDQVCVVIADYAMPPMTGLELFSALGDARAQRILLTGVADNEVAVRAFNAGLIQRFVSKADGDALAALSTVIGALRERCLAERCARLRTLLIERGAAIFEDAEAQAAVSAAMDAAGVRDYAYTFSPPGFVCRLADGSTRALVIASEELMRAHREVAADQGAPAALMDALRAGTLIPCFPGHPNGFFDAAHADHYADFCPPAEPAGDRHRMAWAPRR
ncbi:CheY-like chemotaxis protein [Natronocella acetinitrilica]|uniref:CheY-like chemotaxis protein n=1 Tax=Natronocella acetinitrilica TaxID=414046 RepID=A0AAE3KAP7_9GAMM|nr:hypothetical protein [Natronocella acetinitrilica]MCP1674615.1 CheY-like chemotaxis protein [Natronocella acetinitrilica]